MRIAIALCFSAVLCTVYASTQLIDPVENAKTKVKSVILSVENTIQYVQRVFADTKADTMMTVMKKWWNQMDNYRDYNDLLVASMRREVNNAKLFEGVDAQYCYNTNYWAIKQHTEDAYTSATECQDKAEKSIESSLEFLNSLISLGQDLIKGLNDILLNCYNDDATKMQTCILSEFGKINTAVKEFENNAKYIEHNAIPASNYVVLQANQCLTNVYMLARFESQNAMLSNTRCVQKAVEKKNNPAV